MGKEYELRKKNFSQEGNFGFGIDEHIDLGIKYDTSTGIFGMDFTVCLKRCGDRVSKRRGRKNRVGKFQRVTRMMPSFGSSRPSAEPFSTEESIWPAYSFTSLLGEVDHVFSDVIELWRK